MLGIRPLGLLIFSISPVLVLSEKDHAHLRPPSRVGSRRRMMQQIADKPYSRMDWQTTPIIDSISPLRAIQSRPIYSSHAIVPVV
jgi:hypothetical protein